MWYGRVMRRASRFPLEGHTNLESAALACLALAFLGFYATALWDIDFFWHAATGRRLVEGGGFPLQDPFGLYGAADFRAVLLLRYAWLSQVLFWAVLEGLGVEGIILLKASVLTGCLILIHRRARLAGPAEPDPRPIGRAGVAESLAVLLLGGITLGRFNGARPQLFSFLLIALILWLVDGFRAGVGRRRLAAIPALAALWANLHGGVVLGAALLGLAAGAVLVEWWVAPGDRGRPPWRLVAALVVAMFATLASPAGLAPYRAVLEFEGGEIQARTSEYLSPLAAGRKLGVWLPGYWALVLLAGVACIRFARRRLIWESAALGVLVVLSLRGFRYVPFFIVAAGPYVARGVSGFLPAPHRELPGRAALASLAAVSLIALAVGVARGSAFQRGLAPGRFPESAVALLREQGVRGRVFSHLSWGGYLLWHVHPRVQPYIDSRTLFFAAGRKGEKPVDRAIFDRYTHILWDTPTGRMFMEREHFDLVLVPPANPLSGEVYPLPPRLLRDPRWRLLHEDTTGYLFVRVR